MFMYQIFIYKFTCSVYPFFMIFDVRAFVFEPLHICCSSICARIPKYVFEKLQGLQYIYLMYVLSVYILDVCVYTWSTFVFLFIHLYACLCHFTEVAKCLLHMHSIHSTSVVCIQV
jgi:hypothetical protein